MRILFLAPQPFFQQRGTPIAARRLLEFLSAEGHEVDVLAFHEGDPVELPRLRIHRTRRLPGTDGIQPGFSVKKLVCDGLLTVRALRMARRGRYDLVHAIEESVFVAALIERLYGIPFVYDMDSSLAQQLTEQVPRLKIAGRVLRAAEGLAVRRSLGVLTVCRTLVETARQYDHRKLIACVEDASLVSADVWSEESLRDVAGNGGPIALYVGNLRRYQGIDLLLESFARAARDVPDATLMLIGGARERIAHYSTMAQALGIASQVRFLGPRPVELLGAYLRQADVLVSPRILGTNTPMKVYSYLDSGRAVLATRLPTHTQILDEEIAELADPTPEAFGAALAGLLRDPARRAALAERAKERAVREFTPEATERKLSRFYYLLTYLVQRRQPPSAAGQVP